MDEVNLLWVVAGAVVGWVAADKSFGKYYGMYHHTWREWRELCIFYRNVVRREPEFRDAKLVMDWKAWQQSLGKSPPASDSNHDPREDAGSGGHMPIFWQFENCPPLDWLTAQMSIDEIQADCPWYRTDGAFGPGVRWQEGDEVWRFSSPKEQWQALAGRGGIALVRQGRTIGWLVTVLS